MDQEEREYLEELQRVHRKNLRRLNLQKAQHSVDVPVILINGIEYEERELARIDEQLKQKILRTISITQNIAVYASRISIGFI